MNLDLASGLLLMCAGILIALFYPQIGTVILICAIAVFCLSILRR